jgi:hypothetical protein
MDTIEVEQVLEPSVNSPKSPPSYNFEFLLTISATLPSVALTPLIKGIVDMFLKTPRMYY